MNFLYQKKKKKYCNEFTRSNKGQISIDTLHNKVANNNKSYQIRKSDQYECRKREDEFVFS